MVSQKRPIWEEQGIYDLIQLSRVGPICNHAMLLVEIRFGEVSTNTFQLPCGMIAPTVFDLRSIVGLCPVGKDYEPFADSDFRFLSHGYSTFIVEHQGYSDVVDAHKHIKFLIYRLFRYIFFPRGGQITKMYVSLATRLHEG